MVRHLHRLPLGASFVAAINTWPRTVPTETVQKGKENLKVLVEEKVDGFTTWRTTGATPTLCP